jgi:predicted glycosyltransferase involved in capsule biosynthesis
MYYNYAGGVVATKKETFMKINGYANSYWGWGNEDDDFSARYVCIYCVYIFLTPCIK